MKISVLGCGWLGLPLGSELIRRGHAVRGSVTRPEKVGTLEAVGITPYCLEFTPEPVGELNDFFGAEVLVITLPPRRSEAGVQIRYPAQIAAILDNVRPDSQLVFTSSTSVYPELGRSVVEGDAGGDIRDSGRAILNAEGLLRARGATILRLAGLYGYDRQPGRRLSGRVVTGGDAPVNLVHRDDVIGTVLGVIEQKVRDVTLNVCADLHPSRREVYIRQAERYGFTPPTFGEPHEKPFKYVSNEKLKEVLSYSFLHPDPLEPAP